MNMYSCCTTGTCLRNSRGACFACFIFCIASLLNIYAQDIDRSRLAPVVPPLSTTGHLRENGRSLSADVDIVLVPATVVDRLNRPVTTLQKRDFGIYEAGIRQDIKYFSQEDVPISIGILLDSSGSMKNDKLELARLAVSEFFANSNREDEYFVVTYSTTPELFTHTTQSVEHIERQLATLVPKGTTPLLDAIYLGLTELKSARYQRRALLVISDGGDNNSRYKTKEIRRMVQECDAQIYAIGVFSPLTIVLDDLRSKMLLKTIAEATGGRAVFVSSATMLPAAAASFSRELRNQYLLGYSPLKLQRDGKLHRITVKLETKMSYPVQLYYKREYLAYR